MATSETAARAALPFGRQEIEGSIGERFARVARAFPQRTAVRTPERQTTYAELAADAAAIARALAARLAKAPRPIALAMAPGAPLFATMLGTLDAGRFYAPLDPGLPPTRLRGIWSDLDAAALIVDAPRRQLAAELAGATVPVWTVDELAAVERASEPAAPGASPDDLAYVLFTSGTTGAPKGVMQSHRNVLHNVRKIGGALAIVPEDRLALLASVGVGASVTDVFGALLHGTAVCPHDLSGDGLRLLPDFVVRERITILHTVPSVFRTMARALDGREDLSSLRAVRLGGEAVHAADFELFRHRFPRRCLLHVGYGATEMNVIRHWAGGPDAAWPGGTPLGYAVDETEVVLLDEDGRETRGVGEIAIRARTLAVGYWRDPDATAAAFRPVPDRPGFREYRTGDLGELLPDGLLLHRGRRDGRWKVRGHRVEAAEVEGALRSVPGVRDAAVRGREAAGRTSLCAWIVTEGGAPATAESLRRALAERVAPSMIPARFVFLAALPRTAAGKVDDGGLPDPGRERPPLAVPQAEPANEAERAVASVFGSVLGLDRIGRDDDFFDLGGDSLAAVAALAELSADLDAALGAADLLEAPTPASLARRAKEKSGRPGEGLVRLGGGGGRRVFVVPGGAGDGPDLFAARRIARAAGGAFSFVALRSAGLPRGAPVSDVFLSRLRAAQPRGPYAIVGDCVGGPVAFSIARRLREAGETVDLLALVDAPFPSSGRRRRARLRARFPAAARLWERGVYLRGRLRHHAAALHSARNGRLAYAWRFGRVAAGGAAGAPPAAGERARDARDGYVSAALAEKPGFFDGDLLLVESEEFARRHHAETWSRAAARPVIVRAPGAHARLLLDHDGLVGDALRRALERAG